MAPYQPNRFDFYKTTDGDGAIGIALGTERYCNENGCTRDFYLQVMLGFGMVNVVFLRLNIKSNWK